MLTGSTTDACVHATMHEVNDSGFGCLLPSGCRSTADAGNHCAALARALMQGGVSGTAMASTTLLAAPP